MVSCQCSLESGGCLTVGNGRPWTSSTKVWCVVRGTPTPYYYSYWVIRCLCDIWLFFAVHPRHLSSEQVRVKVCRACSCVYIAATIYICKSKCSEAANLVIPTTWLSLYFSRPLSLYMPYI